MKKLRLIKLYGLSALVLTAVLMAYPPRSGSSQTYSYIAAFDSNPPSYSYEIEQLKYDIENLRKKEAEIIEKKLSAVPKVVVKTKIKKVVKERDSAAVWLRHPDGSVERLVFSTEQVPIINLVSDTISDTVKVRRKWLLFGEYRAL